MDFDYLRKTTAANLASLTNLALAPRHQKNVGIEVKDLTNFSTLVWEAPEENTFDTNFN
jgi:hypothetical protein